MNSQKYFDKKICTGFTKISLFQLYVHNSTSPTGQRCYRTITLRVLNMWRIRRDRWTNKQMQQQSSEGGYLNIFVDHLTQHRISLWPRTAEKRGFCTCVTDGCTDVRTDGWTDKPSYRDAFLTDASKKGCVNINFKDIQKHAIYIILNLLQVQKGLHSQPKCTIEDREEWVEESKFIGIKWDRKGLALVHSFVHSSNDLKYLLATSYSS